MTRRRWRQSAPAGAGLQPREVERVLSEAGLLRSPRRAARGEEPFARRLRRALVRLGPVATELGLYLSSRADLLPAADCMELAGLQDLGEPMLPAEVAALLAGELGRNPGEVFVAFEDRPYECRLFTQSHAARLPTGETVVVRLLRPGLAERIDGDLRLLDSLAAAFAEAGRPPLGDAVSEAREILERRIDLTAEADALELLTLDAGDWGALRVPRVERGLTTPGLLVLEHLGGSPLADAGGDRGELARRTCLAWLHQALRGRILPIEPRGTCLEVLPDKRIAITSGLFARTTAAAQANAVSYLAAVASRGDPDEVCDRLLREMTREGPPSSEERLRLRLRQAVPFRDGCWDANREKVAEHLFLHWRFARECGFRPRPQFAAFCRGLATLSMVTARLAPDQDALRQSLEDFRLAASIAQMGDIADIHRLAQNMERYAVLMAQLPERIDLALTLAANSPRRAASTNRPERWSLLALVTLLLALAATALLARELGGAIWTQRLAAAVFFVLGALALRWGVRR